MEGTMVLQGAGLTKVYQRGRVRVSALRDVSLAVRAGETVAIMGPSGSGKTTLLNLLAGLDRPSAGTVSIDGVRLDRLDGEEATAFRRRHIGFVFQFFNLLPTMSARDNVALPLLAARFGHREIEDRMAEMLEAVGVRHRETHLPDEMSGGEQQRVAIARALVMRPKLLLADEPTGNLDSESGRQILDLLNEAARCYELAIVMVTHSEAAAGRADRILVLRDGALDSARGAPGKRAITM